METTSTLVQQEVESIMANIDESTVNEEAKEVCKFYLEGKCRFGEDCINIHEGEPTIPKKKISKHVEKSEKDSSKKKSSMKTATDVIKRLQWDKSLNDTLFTIGYMDRFLGVLEKPFCDFCWENLASVDDTEVFAIPRHRIQYFKYRGEKVWDKASRLDLIFGSTGDTRGIHAIIDEIDELKINEQEDSSDYTSDSDDYSDSEDENDARVYICDPRSKINELKVQEEDRSTHFIAIHVKEPKILEGINEVQNSIRTEEELLGDCCMSSGLVHLTLDMLRLDGPEGIRECIDLIQSVKDAVQQLPKIELNLEGIGTFGQRVLYAKVQPDNPLNFDQLRSVILSAILQKSSHIKTTNKFEYVPHVTMAKISRPISRLRRSKYIPGSYYSQYIDKKFGKFVVDNVKLCVIDDDRGPDGFYQTLTTITF